MQASTDSWTAVVVAAAARAAARGSGKKPDGPGGAPDKPGLSRAGEKWKEREVNGEEEEMEGGRSGGRKGTWGEWLEQEREKGMERKLGFQPRFELELSKTVYLSIFWVTVIVPNKTVWGAGRGLQTRPNGGRQDLAQAGETLWRPARSCGGRQDLVEAGEMMWMQATVCRGRRHYGEACDTMWRQARLCGGRRGRVDAKLRTMQASAGGGRPA